MTEEEIKKFFEQVKGKKIFWTSWTSNREFFIPEECDIKRGGLLSGFLTYLSEFGMKIEQYCQYNIITGFDPTMDGYKWILLNEPNTNITLQKQPCNCDINNLMNHGCKCGGI